MALKNREEMLEKFISENNHLKDKVRTLEKLAERLKLENNGNKSVLTKKAALDTSTSHFPVIRSAGNASGGPRYTTSTGIMNMNASQSHVRFSINDEGRDSKKRAESLEKEQLQRSGWKFWRDSTSSMKRTNSVSGKVMPFSKKVSSKKEICFFFILVSL